ncbi:Solute-binding protein [Sporomusa silvacetica DSM 10669]|uniref:Solute-binding protein n=1 Tax=Sporomusa silvacetica DSM 10669 TaxID=1123289 RepID=A0ABZ3IUG6_9FIRM|nr:TRAP transporter substrate-binding protein [Sporomusa silvacetica]OZC21176.1 2,3-diketo-L-gulonate-binding periplasmic protein YiaO precursor [Sporomusa silvacetica DSM 10669]
MKKVLSIFLAIAMLGSLLVMSGCSNSKKAVDNGAAAGKKITLKLSHQMSPDHTLHLSALKFAELVKAKTNGNVEVQVFPSGQLGTEKDNAAALKLGTLDMGMVAVEFYPSFVPESAVLVLPYMYRDYAHLDRVLNSDVAQDVSNMVLQKTNIRVLTYLPMAFRQMFTVDKEIKTVADLQGVKMRVPESPIYVATFKQFNAVPTPVAWGEVYTGLQTGVIKGVENTPEAIVSASINEVTKYMNITNHLEGPSTISISEAVYKKLPKEYQEAIISAAQEAEKYELDLTISRDKEAREKLAKTLTITEADATSFKSSVKYDEINLVNTEKGKELIKRLSAIQ